MGAAGAIVVGMALGVIGSIPPAVLFERALRGPQSPSVAMGLVAIMVSLGLLASALFVVRLVWRSQLLAFGCAEVFSFLLVWGVEAWRGWQAANALAGPGERNRGESTRKTRRGDGRAC